jgi:TonB family protein
MEARNRNRLVLALVLLVVALIVVLAKNHDFWFGSDESAEADVTAPVAAPSPTSASPAPASDAKAVSPAPASTAKATIAAAAPVQAQVKKAPAATTSVAAAPTPAPSKPAPVVTANAAPVAKKNASTTEIITKASAEPAKPAAPSVETTRTKLPPMEVEVVAGNTHRALRPGSNAVLVEIPTHSDSRAAASKSFQWNPVTNAAEITRLASNDVPSQGQGASYPSLSKQMKVLGSVVLQAYVGPDGGIRDLHVISGNPILVSAAVEAARQWKFAPYMQNGQAVETQAKIQVNFTINVM